MRILHLGKYYPPDRGGIETATQTIVEYLWSQKIQCDVICFSTQKTEAEQHAFGRILRFKPLVKMLSTPFSFGYWLTAIKELRQADYVHAHVPNPIVFLLLPFMGRQKKLIVHWHSDVVSQKYSYLLYRPFEAWLLKRADKVIVGTQEYAKASKPLKHHQHKLDFIPYSTKPSTSQLQKKKSEQITVLAVGRLVKYKGFEYLVEAASQLPQNIKIIIIGDGPEKPTLENIIQQLNLKNVEILSRVHDLQEYLQKADVFCLPSISRAESFGISLIEAMSFGLPLITTDNTGSGMNFINQNGVSGLVVKRFSADELSKAILQLAQSEEARGQFAKNSLERFFSHFENDRVLQSYKSVYQVRRDGP